MGNRATKSTLRTAIIFLNISADEISATDDKFWAQIFNEEAGTADEVIKGITIQEIRMLRDGAPKNFATLAYKMVERLCLATGTLCNTPSQQTAVLNAAKILARMLPCFFEDPQWRHFFELNAINLTNELRAQPDLSYPKKSGAERDYNAYLPPKRPGSRSPAVAAAATPDERDHKEAHLEELLMGGEQLLLAAGSNSCSATPPMTGEPHKPSDSQRTLLRTLIMSLCDLLFCPEFTVLSHGTNYLANAVDAPPEDLKSLSTYDYVWEPGVGFDSSVNSTTYYDKNRSELLRALLVCLSQTLYESPERSIGSRNLWLDTFVSRDNRHSLPLFTSLMNVVLGHKPPRPFLSQFLFESSRECLVELSCQLLIAVLDCNGGSDTNDSPGAESAPAAQNTFIEYMSRIHREEDFEFIVRGLTRLLQQNLDQTGYVAWSSAKCHLELNQELQVLLWRICNLNRKFIQFLLKSSELLDIVVPILYHLNKNFREPSRTALIHVGVFNLLILSGERNFGVRLNKPYACSSPLLENLPIPAEGSHADLVILIFHKLIMYGYKISQLYDYLLTILVNVSPYLKGMTLLACKCLIQLFETFSSVLVIFTEPNYHQLAVFLAEIFNNLIQYQFDGNANLVYIILHKRDLFLRLANLATSQKSIDKVLKRLRKQKERIDQLDRQATASLDDETNQLEGPQDSSSHERQAAELVHGNDDKTDQVYGKRGAGLGSTQVATVSCGGQSNVSSASGACTKQEVSLVATPDLQHATLSIHPFDFQAELQANPAAGSKSKDSPGARQLNKGENSEQKPGVRSLDDILHEADESQLIASAASNSDPLATSTAIDYYRLLSECEFSLKLDVAGERAGATKDTTERPFDRQNPDAPAGEQWRPTSDWLRKWKQSLPLETVLRMISALGPQVEQLKEKQRSAGTSGPDESAIIKFLQNGTLVGLLPVPHPIQIRKYRTNQRSTMWFRACTWGIIYVRGTSWTGTDIKLIKIL